MKKLLTLLFSISIFSLWANMASPYIEGTLGASAFVSEQVDIEKENLIITIDENFEFAVYEIEYHISTDQNGVQIPLLFYAMDLWYEENASQNFQVWLDDDLVEVLAIPQDFYFEDSTMLFADFERYFFGGDDDYEGVFEMADSKSSSFYVSPSDLRYFETDIDSGKHIIKVSYQASVWTYEDTWISQKSFRYALSPAQYWQSFSELSVIIDASALDGEVNTNLPKSTEEMVWHFDNIPTEVILIEKVNEVSSLAQTLINISPFNLAIICGLILLLLHTFFMYRYRKNNPTKGFSWIALVGGILVPALTVVSFVASYSLIDALLGKLASGRASYGMVFAVIGITPFLFIGYVMYSFWVDFLFKKKLKI